MRAISRRNFLIIGSPPPPRPQRAAPPMSEALLDVADRNGTALRFAVGDRVLCRVGGGHGGAADGSPIDCGRERTPRWLAGTVAQLFHVQEEAERVARAAGSAWPPRTFPPGRCAPYRVKLDDGRKIFVYTPTDADGEIKASGELPRPDFVEEFSRVAGAPRGADSAASEPPRPPPTSTAVSLHGVEEARRRALALGVVDAPRTPQASAATPRAPQTSEVRRTASGRSNVAEVRCTLDAAIYPANWSAAERAAAAAWDALPLAAKRRRMDEVHRDILRKCEEASQRKAAKRAAKVAARVEAVPPMPRKLRPKPRARQGNSHFVGPGKFYADWNEFDADLDKWEAERAARKELMAERHEAQQRVFRAKHPRLVSG